LRKKSLDDEIIDLFKNQDQEFRWSEIRNLLLCYESMEPKTYDAENAFTVKLSRSLNRLSRPGKMQTLEKHNEGHKKVTYSLTEEARKNILEERDFGVSNIMAGVYKPGMTEEELHEKALDKWIEFFEKKQWPGMAKSFQEAKEQGEIK
jgi:hypothetical protein